MIKEQMSKDSSLYDQEKTGMDMCTFLTTHSFLDSLNFTGAKYFIFLFFSDQIWN